jgi:chlorobactene glucosyltransferase
MMLYVVGLLPTWLVKRSKNAAFSAANGQFMFYRRAAYEAIGGHAAVRGAVLEDVIMGQRIKKAGFKQLLPDGTDTVTCRMYHSSQEVWNGFSKNIYAFFGFKLYWIILFLAINLLIFIGPYFCLLFGWLTQRPNNITWLWLPLAQIVLAWLIRLGIAIRFGFRGIDIFLHPISIIYMIFIAINSVRWRKRGVQWKGRTYGRMKDEG